MELSILAAKIISLLYLAAGISALSGQMTFKGILEDLMASRALSFAMGFVALIVGVLLVTYHNIWVKDWTVLITIIGWAALIKGFMFIAYPDSLSWFRGWFKNSQAFGVLAIAISLLFGYFGFVA
ncbi:hypothetical protein KJ657_04890 [Patescibacteria group bacterium]|nr:hypothetical protein [Patescibacteria group bacterium]MBU1016391.1 hypothetical protein [Patescibacteria group bacterium]MBU1685139.1 hypothetical protein [Patescibacteria group bacterium]MBU1938796.1 hypothetical protein [Patescibacteria group bacterium]